MATPLVMDFFSRYFAAQYDEKQNITVPLAAQSFFGRTETASLTVFSPNSLDIDIDVVRTKETTSAFVPRGTLGKFIGSTHKDLKLTQATTFARKFTLIEEDIPIGAGQLLNRLPGEGPYEGMTQATRLRELGRRGYMEAIRRILRLQEVLAWQSITSGVQSAQSLTDTTTNIYDFRRAAANTPSLSHGWGHASGVPLTDIDALCDVLLANGKLVPDFMIFGGTSMQYFLANSTVYTAYANKFYYELLRFGQDFQPGPEFARFIKAGLIPFGKLRTPKGYSLTVFTYPRYYTSDAGTATKYLNDQYVVMGSTQSRNDRFFGPPERLPVTTQEMAEMSERFGFNSAAPAMPMGIEDPGATLLPQEFFVDFYAPEGKKSLNLRVQAAPIFATTMTDAWGRMTAGVAT